MSNSFTSNVTYESRTSGGASAEDEVLGSELLAPAELPIRGVLAGELPLSGTLVSEGCREVFTIDGGESSSDR